MTEEMKKARAFIDGLTVDAPDADPKVIVENEDLFFAWDNEHRSRKNGKAFLYDWSYYIGVVMEGLYYMYEAGEGERYRAYVQRYLQAVETGGALNAYAGYVPDHGLDCYKTASLLPFFYAEDPELKQVADALWRDLYTVNRPYAPVELGHNYWHVWDHGKPPRYKVWLDGLYMGQVFMARYAAMTGNTEALREIAQRFRWVNSELIHPENGLLYHAGNGREDVCPFHWLRAVGWYAMAQVDVMEHLMPEDREELAAFFRRFCETMLKYRDVSSGLWLNLIDAPRDDGNRPEASGTAMMSYAILKGARTGLLAPSWAETGAQVFEALTREKLQGRALTDVYLMATASGQDNYRRPDYYMPQEGKGVGPYIMAYAEMLKRRPRLV